MTATVPAAGGRPAAASAVHVEVTVIVPVSERPHDLGRLYREAVAVLGTAVARHEFIFALEPWHEPLAAPLLELRRAGEPIRVLVAGQGLGEGGLFRAAASQATTDLLLILPAYPRVVPEGLRELLDEAVRSDADVVVARRWPRRDGLVNRLQNRAFHALLRATVGATVHDVACGVRIVRRSVVSTLPLHGDSFRFMPVLAAREGYAVHEVEIEQHPADRQVRTYRPGVYVRRLLDVLGLFFLARFVEKPLRFFGLVGAGAAVAGAVTLAVVVTQRLAGRELADRPLFVLALLLVVLGVQAIALGLIGEMIVHLSAGKRPAYRVREIVSSAPPDGRR